MVMEEAFRKLEKEIDVVKLIRSRRFVHMAIKHLLDNSVRKELKAKSHFKEIDIAQQVFQDPLYDVSNLEIQKLHKKEKKISNLSPNDLSMISAVEAK